MTGQKRVSKGVPTGGQFAVGLKFESEDLDDSWAEFSPEDIRDMEYGPDRAAAIVARDKIVVAVESLGAQASPGRDGWRYPYSSFRIALANPKTGRTIIREWDNPPGATEPPTSCGVLNWCGYEAELVEEHRDADSWSRRDRSYCEGGFFRGVQGGRSRTYTAARKARDELRDFLGESYGPMVAMKDEDLEAPPVTTADH